MPGNFDGRLVVGIFPLPIGFGNDGFVLTGLLCRPGNRGGLPVDGPFPEFGFVVVGNLVTGFETPPNPRLGLELFGLNVELPLPVETLPKLNLLTPPGRPLCELPPNRDELLPLFREPLELLPLEKPRKELLEPPFLPDLN